MCYGPVIYAIYSEKSGAGSREAETESSQDECSYSANEEKWDGEITNAAIAYIILFWYVCALLIYCLN